VPVIVREANRNECMLMCWGLIPWAKDQMINARAETLMDKPAFKSLVGRRLHNSSRWILRVEERGEAKSADVGLSQKSRAVRTG